MKAIHTISKMPISSLIGIVLNLCFVYTFLKVWIQPQVDDVEMIFSLIVLVFFEFVLVHSGVFMIAFGQSWKAWLFLIVFYGLFALAFNAIVKNNQILILYSAVVLNRMLPKLLNKEKTDNRKELGISVGYAMIYIVLIISVVFASTIIPQFGLTPEFLEAANYDDIKSRINGDIIDMPHAIICFGILYYLILTFMDLILIIRRMKMQFVTVDNTQIS
jgi:hypothetical protein